jgi:hypothetical protein
MSANGTCPQCKNEYERVAFHMSISESCEITEQILLDEVMKVKDELGRVPTKDEFKSNSLFGYKTYRNRFNGWNDVLEKCNLDVNQEKECLKSDNELIKEIRQVVKDLGKAPSEKEIKENTNWGHSLYANRFGSWNKALEAAGLEVNKKSWSKEELIDNIKTIKNKLERVPVRKDLYNFDGPSPQPYYNKFGSWNSALEAAGFETRYVSGTGEQEYGADWTESRQETLERDDYTCQVCGFEDESNHVHHIKPRKDFDNVSDSNTDDNLITLCASCHRHCEGRWTDCDPDEFAERATEMLM